MDSMTPSSPRRSTSKTLSLVAIVGLLALVIALDIGRRKAENEVAQLTTRLNTVVGGSNEQSKEDAAKIIAQLGKLVVLVSKTPTVAQVVKADQLRPTNKFYETANDGDYVVIDSDGTTATAYLFDAKANIIKKTVPVQFSNTSSAPAAATPKVQATP